MPARVRVCSYVGCPHLTPCPNPDHAPRPRNQPWSRDRDRSKQHALRQAVLHRDNYACTRCGSTENLIAHHDKPGYEPDAGRTLCNDCHKDIDRNAR